VSLLFAEAPVGSKCNPSNPHTAGLLTFCLRPNPRWPVPSHGDSDAEFVCLHLLT